MKVNELKSAAERGIHRYLIDLELFVNIDSGTYDRELVNQAGRFVASVFERSGCQIEWVTSSRADIADTYLARVRGSGSRRILMIGHHDTVWPAGAAAERPYKEVDQEAFGPAVSDMKSGVLLGVYAIALLRDLGFDDFEQVTFIGNADEEIGSPTSRELIEREAVDADYVLVLEPGRSPGAIQTTRKGVGMYELTVTGRSSHAGAQPEEGRSAVLELAHKTIALQELTNFDTGTTVNVGIVHGGTRRNVVPESATASIDLRASTSEEAKRADQAIREIAARQYVPDSRSDLTGGMNRPPMEKTEATVRVLDAGRRIVEDLGLSFDEVSSGGGSDGNFTAALGVPTLDGLGPVGYGAHALHEGIRLDSLADRLALVAGLIAFGPSRSNRA